MAERKFVRNRSMCRAPFAFCHSIAHLTSLNPAAAGSPGLHPCCNGGLKKKYSSKAFFGSGKYPPAMEGPLFVLTSIIRAHTFSPLWAPVVERISIFWDRFVVTGFWNSTLSRHLRPRTLYLWAHGDNLQIFLSSQIFVYNFPPNTFSSLILSGVIDASHLTNFENCWAYGKAQVCSKLIVLAKGLFGVSERAKPIISMRLQHDKKS